MSAAAGQKKEGFPIRTSGILMPVSSLPSRYGIGNLGEEAYRFVDFLKAAGQKYWQILPIGPTGYGDSPYQSFSAFAANPYFIDPDILAEKGLLTREEIRAFPFGFDPEAVDYGVLFENRFALLEKATARYDTKSEEFAAFRSENADWLADYALFMALKEEQGMVSFHLWPEELIRREPEALRKAQKRLEARVRFWEIVQALFYDQWFRLKDYAHKNGVRIIGDLPIYVSPDSSDLWAHSELFQVDEAKAMTEVAGCPPDAFTDEGQYWGNPLYDWGAHRETGFAWWLRRLSFAGKVYDVVRIDHFRGFESYYSILATEKTAVHGKWRKGPGMEFIRAVRKELPELPIIAEDLGFLTAGVRRLLRQSGFPGMKVLQFAFDSREESDYLPHNYGHNSVVYTGTHDNTTTEDWQYSAPSEDAAFARRYFGMTPQSDFTYCLIRAALGSVADTCVIPMQDYLRLGRKARINTPGTLGGNWRWRVKKESLTAELAGRIRVLSKMYGR
jgi:4-alpha-glucanotransferase